MFRETMHPLSFYLRLFAVYELCARSPRLKTSHAFLATLLWEIQEALYFSCVRARFTICVEKYCAGATRNLLRVHGRGYLFLSLGFLPFNCRDNRCSAATSLLYPFLRSPFCLCTLAIFTRLCSFESCRHFTGILAKRKEKNKRTISIFCRK